MTLATRCALFRSPALARIRSTTTTHQFIIATTTSMAFDDLADDAIAFTITSSDECSLHKPRGLAFDLHRGHLLVADDFGSSIKIYSSNDGSFVCKFGSRGNEPGQFLNPYGIAIDHQHDRIIIAEMLNHRLQLVSLIDHSFVSFIDEEQLAYPQDVAVDKHHQRIIAIDTSYPLHARSAIDLSFLFSTKGNRSGLNYPSSVAIDDDRHRIIVSDTNNHRVQVLSSIDGSFLFEFGSQGDQPCQFYNPRGVCIANQGRIIIADFYNHRLQSFTHEGHHISSFACGIEKPFGVAFDEHRGLIAFSAGHQVHVIGANQWLADTFTWLVARLRYAPRWMKQAVSTMTMIRSLVDDSNAMSMIPNELLFEIFSYL